MNRLRTLRTAAPFLLLIGCADLASIEPEVCGNGILEAGEDCDGAADPALGPAVRCGAADDEVEARRCRFTCDTDADCPGGFACGADAVCRAPSARFAAVDGPPLALPFATVRAEDVDGDGVIDLLGSGNGRLTVRYGDGTGRFDTTLTSVAPTDTVPVTTADVDLNGTLDLVYGFGGVWVGRTTSDRRLDPAAARFDLPGVFPGGFLGLSLKRNIEPGARRDHTLMNLVATDNAFVQVVFPRTSELIFLPGAVYHPLEDLTEVPVANIDDVPGQVEDDYALAFRGEDEIWIYGLTPEIAASGAEEELVLRATVSLAGLGVVDRGSHFGDIDGDGKVDLMISVRDGEQTAIAIAKGDGGGGFAAPTLDPAFAIACAERPNCNPWPLAVGDLNLDGRADFVMQDDFFLISRANGAYGRFSVSLPEPWTRAIIADFNGDGWPDVAASSVNIGLDLFLGDGLGYFTSALLETRGVPVALATGDFDGDLISDLVVAETSGGGVTDVSVMFGAEHEILGAAIHQGSFTGFVQLLPTQTLNFYDIADELFVLTEDAPGVFSTALLVGTFIRVMVAPYRLQTRSGSSTFDVRNLVAGRFDDDERPDVIAFSSTSTASDFDDRIWFVQGVEGDVFKSPPYEEATDFETTVGIEQFDPRCALLTAGDFDGDGTDELIGVSDKASCNGTDPLRVLHASFVPEFQPRLLPIEAGLTEPVELSTADVDADGHLDLIVVFRGTASTTTRQNAGIIIFYGSAAGFTLDTARLVQTADVGFEPISVAALQTDGDPELELAILTGDGLWLADAAELRTHTTGSQAVVSGSTANGHVLSADVDDDGLDDLITFTELGARVLLAVPAAAGQR